MRSGCDVLTGIAAELESLASDANDLHAKAEMTAYGAVEYARQCGQKLIEAKAALSHGRWLAWLDENFNGGRRNAYNYMRIALNLQRAANLPEPSCPDSIRAALRLLAGPGKSSHQQITSSDSIDWYTPPEYVEAAREVIGDIDLDPATCEAANAVVQAAKTFTAADDGLGKEWGGRVWMNPPYGRACAAFVAKLIDSYESGRVTEAVILVNSNSTDTEWFRPLWDYVLCFSYGRVNFRNENQPKNGPTHGSCFVYLGMNVERFKAVFSRHGAVVGRL